MTFGGKTGTIAVCWFGVETPTQRRLTSAQSTLRGTILNIYRCDNCPKEAEAIRKGIYQLLPDGWYVIADGPVGSREVELHVCSQPCMEQRAEKCRQLGTLDVGKMTIKRISRQEAR